MTVRLTPGPALFFLWPLQGAIPSAVFSSSLYDVSSAVTAHQNAVKAALSCVIPGLRLPTYYYLRRRYKVQPATKARRSAAHRGRFAAHGRRTAGKSDTPTSLYSAGETMGGAQRRQLVLSCEDRGTEEEGAPLRARLALTSRLQESP